MQLEKSVHCHLYTLTQNETVIGIFIVVKSQKTVYRHSGDPGPKGTISDKFGWSVRAKTGQRTRGQSESGWE